MNQVIENDPEKAIFVKESTRIRFKTYCAANSLTYDEGLNYLLNNKEEIRHE